MKTLNFKGLTGLFTLLLVSQFCFSQAHSWKSVGDEWYYHVEPDGGYINIEKTKDTVVNNITCDVLERRFMGFHPITHQPSGGIWGYSITYQSGDTVFIYQNGRFQVLYNFGCKVGDTINTADYGGCGPDFFIVDRVDTMIVDGKIKRYYIAISNKGGVSYFHKIVEDIGNLSYLVPIRDCSTDGEGGSGLRCYRDKDINYHPYNIDCDYLPTGIDEKTAQRLDVSPNPVATELTISTIGAIGSAYSVFDVNGKKIHTGIITSDKTKLDLSAAPSGMYFLRVNGKSWFNQTISKL